MTTISIVLPTYNGEEYLEATLDSISRQTMVDFEVICIDDSSSDSSLSILAKFSAKDYRFKVFTKERGGSAVKSIIHALPLCMGDYFFYCSQDDLLSDDLLEKMYDRSVQTRADAVIPDMIFYHRAGPNQEGIFPPDNNYDLELTGEEAFTLSLNWSVHGFSLRKMKLVRELGYDNLYANSDEYTTRLYYLTSKKIVFSKGTFYYRQDNPNSLTNSFSPLLFDYLLTDVRLLKLMSSRNIAKDHVNRYLDSRIESFKDYRNMFRHYSGELSSRDWDTIHYTLLRAKRGLLWFALKNRKVRQLLRLIATGSLGVNRSTG